MKGMKIIDLSHTIEAGMPVYPSDDPPVITTRASIDEDGFAGKSLTIGSHNGTHIDGPTHIFPASRPLDRIPVDCFVGEGSVIDLTAITKPEIHVSYLKTHESLFKSSRFILLHTGWSRYWGQEKYFRGYPSLSIEAALWIDSFGLTGLGIDTCSVDAMESTDLPIHKILLERTLIIENLTNLHSLPHTGFWFSCLPLKVADAEASPIRAVAIIKRK